MDSVVLNTDVWALPSTKSPSCQLLWNKVHALHGTKAFQNTFEKNTYVVIHYCLNKNTYKKLVIATFSVQARNIS